MLDSNDRYDNMKQMPNYYTQTVLAHLASQRVGGSTHHQVHEPQKYLAKRMLWGAVGVEWEWGGVRRSGCVKARLSLTTDGNQTIDTNVCI